MTLRNRTVGILMCLLALAAQPVRSEKVVVDTDRLDPQVVETLRKDGAKTITPREAERAVRHTEAQKNWDQSSDALKIAVIVLIIAIIVLGLIFAPQALAVGLVKDVSLQLQSENPEQFSAMLTYAFEKLANNGRTVHLQKLKQGRRERVFSADVEHRVEKIWVNTTRYRTEAEAETAIKAVCKGYSRERARKKYGPRKKRVQS